MINIEFDSDNDNSYSSEVESKDEEDIKVKKKKTIYKQILNFVKKSAKNKNAKSSNITNININNKDNDDNNNNQKNQKNKETLILSDNFNIPITSDLLPTKLYGLTFGRSFNNVIQPSTLPSTLKSLTFGDSYNRPLQANSLPSSLKSLVFGLSFNQPIMPNVLPSTLISLTMGTSFNKPLNSKVLPLGLRCLVLSDTYRFPLELPPKLEQLTLGKWYNHDIALVSTLKYIKIGHQVFSNLNLAENSIMTKDFAYEISPLADEGYTHIDITNDTYDKCLFVVVTKETSVVDNHLFTINMNSSHPIQCLEEVGCCWVTMFVECKLTKKYIQVFSSVRVEKGHSFRIEKKYLIVNRNGSLIHSISESFNIFESFEINQQLYYRMKRFDNGTNKVFLVLSNDTKELLISKEIRYSNFNQKRYDRIFTEIEAMIKLRGSPNIVQYFTYSNDQVNQIVYILMEYCDGGDLHQLLSEKVNWNNKIKVLHSNHQLSRSLLENSTQYFKEEEIWHFSTELLNILTVLDNNSIIHCDIKPSNLFIKNNQILLGDFGCCKIIALDESDESITSLNSTSSDSIKVPSVGTHGYLAQELELKLDYDGRVDIYSVGSTILRLLSCHPEDCLNHSLIETEKDNVVISRDRYSLDLIEFVRSLLVAKREDRITLQKILNHAQIGEKRKYWTYYFDIPIKYPITHSITKLTFTHHFNQPISSDLLPNTLKMIEFTRSSSFNQPIDISTFPESLVILKLGGFFDHPVHKGCLPSNLKVLHFGDEFNSRIDIDALPLSLQVLVFGKSFKQKLHPLPQNLKNLTLNWNYCLNLNDSTLPPSLNKLTSRKSITRNIKLNENTTHFIIWRKKR